MASTVVIAIGLPVVPEAKVEKMKGYIVTQLINKTMKPDQKSSKTETIEVETKDIEIPVDENGNTIGACFITMPNSQAALNLATRCDNIAFDKHTKERMRFMTKDGFDKFFSGSNAPTKIVVPEPTGDPAQFSWFFMKEDMLDQIAFVSNNIPQASWFNHNKASIEPIGLPSHLKKCDDISFTADGSFFVTKTGTKLNFYAGKDWMHFTTLEFPDLDTYSNSPCGRFLLTKAKAKVDIDNMYMPNGAAVFDILTGKKLVRIPVNKGCDVEFGASSHVFTLQNRQLLCYKAKEYKECVEICHDIDQFSPSLASNYIFTFREQKGTQPPRIAFYSSETNQIVHVSAAFNAIKCIPIWHPTKPLCAVIQERIVKKNHEFTLTIFDLTEEKSVGTFSADERGEITCCAWDPTNNNCAAIFATDKGCQLIIYEIAKNISKIYEFQCGSHTKLQYSPAGRFLVASSKSSNVQFFDTHYGLIASKELKGNITLEWEQSGAFLLASNTSNSSGTSWFSIYLIDGNQVLKKQQPSLSKVIWRPRTAENLIIKPEDIEKVQEDVEKLIEKNGKFGAIDRKSIEEEDRQKKISDLREWDSLMPEQSMQRKPKTVGYDFSPYEEFEDKE